MKILANVVVVGFLVLLALIGVAAYDHNQRLKSFQTECQRIGGDTIIRYREPPLCLPKGTIIPIN